MNHEDARRGASLALDDSLDPELERELAVHLVSCPDCRSFYELGGRTRETLHRVPRSMPPERLLAHATLRATAVLRGEPDPGPAGSRTDAESTGELSRLSGEQPVAPAPIEDLGPPRTSRRERRAARRDATGRASRVPLVAALAIVLVVAVVASLVVTRGTQVRDRLMPRTPEPSTLVRRVGSAFDAMTTFQGSFRIMRLGLYRQPDDQKVIYAFTNATERGRLVFDSGKLRQERTLEVVGQPATTQTTVIDAGQVTTLTAQSGATRISTTANAPFGPPDGPMAARLGVLEPAVGTVARLLASARDVQVRGQATVDRRRAWRVTFPVAADEQSRADRIELLVDAATWLPVRVERSIARASAGVLGPKDVLAEAAIDAQFAGRERAATETVELSDVKLGGNVPEGAFTVAAPDGATSDRSDARWKSTSRAALTLPFRPLQPSEPPSGFREIAVSALDGKPQPWGPKRAFPAYDAAFQSEWSDGRTTIVLSERRVPRQRERVLGSPLGGSDLPLQTRPVVRSGRQFEYAFSPEVPPHVYGFIGEVFVMAVGWATADDLVRMLATLELSGADTLGTDSPAASPSVPASARPGRTARP